MLRVPSLNESRVMAPRQCDILKVSVLDDKTLNIVTNIQNPVSVGAFQQIRDRAIPGSRDTTLGGMVSYLAAGSWQQFFVDSFYGRTPQVPHGPGTGGPSKV